ncbi:PH domain-containing protein [Heyndrickxia coagulans]|uniref:PH domain-containing protein n=1 Tax=Heyndrickxia coagulans TaxID=1398 RepID=UPI0022359E30|nr:PH domain-containing protein [Heyndrickxia coagulans]UZH06423.1 PH domain-containing protein [Heyndrickxia coagulans]
MKSQHSLNRDYLYTILLRRELLWLFSTHLQKTGTKSKYRNFYSKETIEHVYGLAIDFVALTNKRLIFVDQSLFGKETGVVSIPYSRIDEIGIVKDKFWSMSDKIMITTKHDKHELKLLQGKDEALKFYNTLAKYIC